VLITAPHRCQQPEGETIQCRSGQINKENIAELAFMLGNLPSAQNFMATR